MKRSQANVWKLGLFVLLGVGLGVVVLFWISLSRYRRETIPAVTYFDESVQGLEPGAPVKIRGVTIGAVRGISMAPDLRHVEVRVDLYTGTVDEIGLSPVHEADGGDGSFAPPEVRVVLTTIGITGIKILEVDFFDPESSPPPELSFATPWNYVPARPSTLKSIEIGLREVFDMLPRVLQGIDRLAATLDESLRAADLGELSRRVQRLLEHLDDMLVELEHEGLAARTAEALEHVAALAEGLRATLEGIDDPEHPLGRRLSQVDGLLATVERAVVDARLDETSAALREATLAFGALARETTGLTGEVHSDLVAFRRAMESLEALGRLLERDPGALLRGRAPAATPGGGGR